MTDLTDRMRTCAAHILATAANERHLYRDAADLLIEASNIIEAPPPAVPEGSARQETIAETRAKHPPGEPMEIIPPQPAARSSVGHYLPDDHPASPMWIAPGGPLPGLTQSGTVSPRACPRCDSRAGKRVYREGNHLMLACPVCGHTWEFKR